MSDKLVKKGNTKPNSGSFKKGVPDNRRERKTTAAARRILLEIANNISIDDIEKMTRRIKSSPRYFLAYLKCITPKNINLDLGVSPDGAENPVLAAIRDVRQKEIIYEVKPDQDNGNGEAKEIKCSVENNSKS